MNINLLIIFGASHEYMSRGGQGFPPYWQFDKETYMLIAGITSETLGEISTVWQ
jgi:hypothetical protein